MPRRPLDGRPLGASAAVGVSTAMPSPVRQGTAAAHAQPTQPSPSSGADSLGPSPKTEGEAGAAVHEEGHDPDESAAHEPHDHDDDAHPHDAKKPRACEACRGLKVRCDMDPAAPPDTPCRRCCKAGRRCIVTQPTRRRQKKTDSRVAELEKKIDALTASLQLTRGAPGGGGGGPGSIATSGSFHETPRWEVATALAALTGTTTIAPPANGTATAAAAAASLTSGTTASPHSSTGLSPFPAHTAAPMVVAGQKRKFTDMWETTGGGGGGGGGDAGADSPTGSPSLRDRIFQMAQSPPPARSGTTPTTASPLTAAPADTPPAPLQSQPPPRPAARPQLQPQPPQPSGTEPSPYSHMSPPPRTQAAGGDIVDRGLLSMDKAVELFQRYTDHMARHMPAVVFAAGTTAAEVRKTKPILFLALMAAATTEIPNVQRAIVKEMMQVFAERIVIVGEKSLELVQALQVSVIWYWPPEHFEELKFYQLVHMAAVMAIDIGLGKRRPGHTGMGVHPNPTPGMPGMSGSLPGGLPRAPLPQVPGTHWREHPFKKHPLPDPCSIEARRAWLSCYFMTSNTSMALHRPNLVRWTSFMTECVEVLERSPGAAPTDPYLCHLVWTHRMAEEVGQQFSMDDPTARINIADPRTQFALRAFERELARYKESIPRALLQPSLRLSFEVLSLYMHEIALQTEEGNDDFRQPHDADSARQALIGDVALTPAHISALSSCLQAIDGIFDAFLGMDIAALRCIPVFNFVRVAYATVVLIKLYFAAASPQSELGRVINKDHMKVEQHLNALLDKFRATAADNRSRPAGKFLIVLVMIRAWFTKQRQQTGHDNTVAAAAAGPPAGPSTGPSTGAGNPSGQPTQAGPTGQANSANQSNTTTPYLPSSSFLSGSQPATSLPDPYPATGTGLPPPQMGGLPSVNTPLELLSEIASGDSAAQDQERILQQEHAQSQSQPQQPQQPPPQQPQQPQQALPQQALQPAQPPQPPQPQMYPWFPVQTAPAAPCALPDGSARIMGTTNSLMSSEFMEFPNVGENFEYAMDLTFAGLAADGGGEMMGLDEMQYFMEDPYWGGGLPDAFSF